MIATMSLEDAIGSQWREKPEGRKADRAAALLYAPKPRAQAAAPAWTLGERWILSGGVRAGAVKYFIGESIREDARAAKEPPFARPGLRRLVGLAYGEVPGPVIVERSRELSPGALAALGGYLALRGRTMITWRSAGDRRGPFTVTTAHRRAWIQDSGHSPATIDGWVQELFAVAESEFTDLLVTRGLEAVTHLGEGPQRSAELALSVALERRDADWDDLQIRNYLNLYGFTNNSGTVGAWSHVQFARLLAGVR